MDVLLLRLEAPLMSFGKVSLDDYGFTDRFPQRSLLTGLIGNALGLDFSDTTVLGDLQERLHYAVRCDREGAVIEDFQTVDVTQRFMQGALLTSYGWTVSRKGHHKTLRRWRQYVADGSYLAAVTLIPEGRPSLDEVEKALQSPARPLFIGRKCCLPSHPIYSGRSQADNLVDALQRAPSEESRLYARWPLDVGPEGRQVVALVEDRDWANGIHVGERHMREGWLELIQGEEA